MLRRLKQFAQNIARLCAWAPVLWRDRDWDYAFLLHIMAFKMRRMARTFEKNNITADAKRMARELRTCAALLDRLSGEDTRQRDLLWERHDKKWGEQQYAHAPDPHKPHWVVVKYWRSGATRPSEEMQEKKEFAQIMDQEENQRLIAEEEFFRIFRRKYLRWWN